MFTYSVLPVRSRLAERQIVLSAVAAEYCELLQRFLIPRRSHISSLIAACA